MEEYATIDAAQSELTIEDVMRKSRIGYIPNTDTGVIERRIYTLNEYLQKALEHEKTNRE